MKHANVYFIIFIVVLRTEMLKLLLCYDLSSMHKWATKLQTKCGKGLSGSVTVIFIGAGRP